MKNKKAEFELSKTLADNSALEADTRVPSDMLNGLYILRLMDEGVSMEKAYDLIIDGILQPN